MSLFRKPTKKIQRRVFACDDDDDGDPEPPPPPVISKKENKHAKTKLLSFADEEEEDGEVFKVKKSSQSKRLAKKREKEKKKDSDNNCENATEVQPDNTKKDKPKKKTTLEGLILSGREALAADGTGDVEEEEGQQEYEETGFHRYRAESVRALLATSEIPDAALIHAARKTRQQAREQGGTDYIPVRTENKGPGSRLVRDDESDDEEGRIEVRGLELPSDKPKRGTMAVDETELDSGGEEWEEQQIKKAVPTITHDITGFTGEIGVNPFSVAPPPPSMEAPPHLRPLHPQPTNAKELLDALAHRLGELRTHRAATALRVTSLQDRLLSSSRTRDRCEAARPTLEAAYKRAQGNRGYITDLIECLDEKMPELEALESRALNLYKRRCEFIQERRRQDVSDQALDVRALTSKVPKPPDSEEKIRRTAEREGRRRARRLERDRLQRTNHREGDSSDDELPPSEAHHFAAERDAIRLASSQLFMDALPQWRSISGVSSRLSRWKSRDRQSYVDAYIPHFLPRLLAPYLRHQLILWNPFADEDNEDLEKMDWYKCLMLYGVKSDPLSSDSDMSAEEDPPSPPRVSEEGVRDDPDLYLVPNLVQKVVVPKLTELISNCWDPMSVRSCVRVRGVIPRVSLHCISPSSTGAPLSALSTALYERLQQCIAADVFLPPLPALISEGPGGAFWRRCVGVGVRLVRGALALTPPPDMLRADTLVLALIGTLCTGAAAAPAPLVSSAAVAICSTLPRGDSTLRTAALKRLAVLAQHALNHLQTDNPMHLKALEQARSVLAEAKAAEQQ